MSTYESRKSSPILHAGKTARDHASGAWARQRENADARREWSKGGSGTAGKKGRPFPLESCNGKESRALRPKVKYVSGTPTACRPHRRHGRGKTA